MAKKKKDGQFVNLYLDKNLLNRLDIHCKEKGQTRTAAVEIMIAAALDAEADAAKTK
jgi:hypothetical protein